VVERCGYWIADERAEYLTEQLIACFGAEKEKPIESKLRTTLPWRSSYGFTPPSGDHLV
jgi:hypothetical protein